MPELYYGVEIRMVDVDKAIIARLKMKGINYEVLVDCENALAFKAGRIKNLDEVLATKDIFNDVKKGLHASFLKESFGTGDINAIAERIIKEGEVQVTSEHKNRMRDELKKRIIAIIHRNAVNPGNNLPHPPARIAGAMEEAKVRIDEHKHADEQVLEIVKKINGILPIKYETRELLLKIPARFLGRALGLQSSMENCLKRNGRIMGICI